MMTNTKINIEDFVKLVCVKDKLYNFRNINNDRVNLYKKYDDSFIDWVNGLVETYNAEQWDLFLCPSPHVEEDGTKASIKECYCAWIDFDFKMGDKDQLRNKYGQFKLRPNIVVKSGGGLHFYWAFEETLTVAQCEELNEKLAIYFGSDRAVKDASRIMRFVYTFNYKYENKPQVLYEIVSNVKYKYSDFKSFLDSNLPEMPKREPFVKKVINVSEGNRNSTLFAETLHLLESNFNEHQVKEQLFEKYVIGLGLPEVEFINTVQSAMNRFDLDSIKDPKVIKANKIKSIINQKMNAGNYSGAKAELDKLSTEEKEYEFISIVKDDNYLPPQKKIYKIGEPLFDSISPFREGSLALLAGFTGTGKTTSSLNLCKAFLKNNPGLNILFLESDTETSMTDIKRFCHKMNIFSDKITFIQFSRSDNPELNMVNIANKYKKAFGKYPEVLVVDTFEKMLSDTQNCNLKQSTEALVKLREVTNSFVLGLSQFSSAQYKTNKASNYYPVTIQQGGTDTVNNVDLWISIKRESLQVTENEYRNYNLFYFGKVREIDSNRLQDKIWRVPFNLENFNLVFEKSTIEEI